MATVNGTTHMTVERPIDLVIARLEARGFDPKDSGSGNWLSRCPGCDSRRRSLSITEGTDGKVLLCCHHVPQCSFDAIVAAIGLEKKDLFSPAGTGSRGQARKPGPKSEKAPKADAKAKPKGPGFKSPGDAIEWWARKEGYTKTTGFPYPDADGNVDFLVYRLDGDGKEKTYRPVSRDPETGGWRFRDPAGPLPLFNLPDVLDADQVWFFEGEKCALIAGTIGLVATTTAHGAKSPGRSDFAPLAGKDVVIVPDKGEAGETYAKLLCPEMEQLNPPPRVRVLRLDLAEDGDDLEQWIAPAIFEGRSLGQIKRDLIRLAEAAPLQSPGAIEDRLAMTAGVVEAPDDPHRLGRRYVEERYRHRHHPRLARYLDEFYEWRDGCHHVIPEGAADNNLTAAIKRQFDELCLRELEAYASLKAEYDRQKEANPSAKGPAPKIPTARKVTGKVFNDTMRALRSMVAVPHTLTEPCWLQPIEGTPKPPDPRDIIPTVDGLVDMGTLAIEDDGSIDLNKIKVYDPTPAFFTCYCLGYSFDADAPRPARWIEFVREVFPDDPESQRELQKWFGYLIGQDTSLQKMLYLIGKTRAGKGTVLRVLMHLIGTANITSPALVELAEPHGLADCVGKPLMLISDARIAGNDGAIALLQERLLKISGEDAVQINRKFRPQFTTKLSTRIVIASNSVPSFRDPSGAFRSRMRPLHFLQSFEGKEDSNLFKDKLLPEMPGILNWAIIGKAMLRQDGGFFVPETARSLVTALSESNPTAMFVEECCETGKDLTASKDDMFMAFQYWCSKTLNRCPAIQTFGKNLRATVPEISDTRLRVRDPFSGKEDRPTGYRGIAINEDFLRGAREWNLARQQRVRI